MDVNFNLSLTNSQTNSNPQPEHPFEPEQPFEQLSLLANEPEHHANEPEQQAQQTSEEPQHHSREISIEIKKLNVQQLTYLLEPPNRWLPREQ